MAIYTEKGGQRINGYVLSARAYQKMLDEHPEEVNRAYYERKIELLSFLGNCTQEDIQELFDSAAFNTICLGYMQMALDALAIEDTSRIIGRVRRLFDEITAAQAAQYYEEH